MNLATELLIVLGLICANAAFAAAEIAVLSVRKSRLMELADEGSRAARILVAMRAAPERFLATVQVGITVVSVTAAAFGGARLAGALEPWFRAVGGGAYAGDLALGAVVVGITFVSVVIGELVPKSLALRHAERVARVAALPLRAAAFVARPIIWLLTASSNVVLRLFGDTTTFTEARLSREELQQLVDEAAIVGTVGRRAGEIASRALDFGTTRVSAVLVPRPDLVVIAHDASPDEVRTLLLDRHHQRYPVRGDTPDEILGYVTARDLVALLVGGSKKTVRSLVREPLWAPEGALATDVLCEMQARRTPIALVFDESGSTVGLATFEDLATELVGEVFTEHAPAVERIRRESRASAVVRGTVPVHEVNRELGLELPIEPGWSTIAGLVVARAGRIPEAGTRVEIDDGTVLEVLQIANRRVTEVRVRARRPLEKPAPSAPEPAH